MIRTHRVLFIFCSVVNPERMSAGAGSSENSLRSITAISDQWIDDAPCGVCFLFLKDKFKGVLSILLMFLHILSVSLLQPSDFSHLTK